MNGCNGCAHQYSCGYFDCNNYDLTEEERFIEHCLGCCCGDGLECNKAEGHGCWNWEDTLVGSFEQPACINCPSNPKNGGDGICFCTLGQQITY